MTKTKIYIKFFILLGLILIAVFLTFALDLNNIVQEHNIREPVRQFGWLTPLIYLALYILLNALFIPTAPLTWISGVLFGSFLGGVYLIIGGTLGSFMAISISNKLGRPLVNKVLKNKHGFLNSIEVRVQKNAFWTVFLLRFTPVFPVNVVNLLAGLFNIKKEKFLLATFLGIIPSSFIFAWLGDSFITFNSRGVVLASVILIALVLAGLLIKREFVK